MRLCKPLKNKNLHLSDLAEPIPKNSLVAIQQFSAESKDKAPPVDLPFSNGSNLNYMMQANDWIHIWIISSWDTSQFLEMHVQVFYFL